MYAIIAALFDINGKESTRRLKTLLAGNNGHPCNEPPGVRVAGTVYVVLVPLPGEIDPAPLKLKVADGEAVRACVLPGWTVAVPGVSVCCANAAEKEPRKAISESLINTPS
jgi:hypothetical protein